MYNQTLYNGLINIVPFWSSNIISIYGLGNEYNIVFNLIISELLKITTQTLNDNILITITLIIGLIILGYKYGFTIKINLFEKKIIKIIGHEIHTDTGFTMEYCNKIKTLNNYLLNTLKISNITYVDDVNIIINESNYVITPKINLSIKRNDKPINKNKIIVIYELTSYSSNIDDFIEKLLLSNKNAINSEITLIGDENNKIISYPEPIHAINYYVNNNNIKFPKLKCMKLVNNLRNEYYIKNENIDKNNKNDTDDKIGDKIIDKKTNNYSYTLDNINNFNLDKVFLTIYRNDSQVIYNIKSNKINCKDWLDEIINNYNQNKNSKFKNKLLLTGKEDIYLTKNSFKIYYYSKAMWTINWLLIEILNCQNFECINGDENVIQYKYVLESLELFKIKDDLFLTVEKEKNSRLFSHENNKYNNCYDIAYTLYSNSLNIKNELEKYIEQFEIYKKKTSKVILYHFTYQGIKNNQLIFNSKILSELDTDKELFETFDKIHNEHVEFFKKNIDKLKDIEYYKTHGLKRKRGFLFHGIPGCGKTSTVVAMALYDSRHIIEIPFSLLSTHQEFEKIMELKSINDIEINNNNIILLFDEIDIGMDKITNRNNNSNLSDLIKNESENIVEGVMKTIMTLEHNIPKNTIEQKLNLGTLLSKLDGIGNYNGLIVIGTTNYIERLDPALYRELRLTPIKFDKLRKEDCIKIIKSYFSCNYNEKLNDIILDRKITPTKLIHLCQTYENLIIEDFFNNILNKNMC